MLRERDGMVFNSWIGKAHTVDIGLMYERLLMWSLWQLKETMEWHFPSANGEAKLIVMTSIDSINYLYYYHLHRYHDHHFSHLAIWINNRFNKENQNHHHHYHHRHDHHCNDRDVIEVTISITNNYYFEWSLGKRSVENL